MWHNIRSREVAPTWAWTMGASSAIRPSDSNSEATLLISLRRDSLALRSWKERKNSVIHCLFKFKYIHKKREGFHMTAAVLCYTTFNYLCVSHTVVEEFFAHFSLQCCFSSQEFASAQLCEHPIKAFQWAELWILTGPCNTSMLFSLFFVDLLLCSDHCPTAWAKFSCYIVTELLRLQFTYK